MSMNCVFSGPPQSGKTTVMKRLKGQRVDVEKKTKSTDIMDEKGPVRIDIMPSCSVVTDQHWVEMEENDEVQAFLNLTIIPNSDAVEMTPESLEKPSWKEEKLYISITVETQSKPTLDSVGTPENEIHSRQTVKDAHENETHSTQRVKDESKTKSKYESEDYSSVESSKTAGEYSSDVKAKHIDLTSSHHLPSPRDVLKQAQHHSQQIRATRQLCKRHFLHLTDTGGQPELRRFTPLLIPGPSITFIVFRLIDKSLEASLASKVCLSTEGKVVEYGSYYCIKDTIEDITQHIFCQEQHSKVRSSIMFIGTHKDQLPKDPAKRKKRIKDKNKEIMDILERCPHYDKDMIVKSGIDKQVIFSVDNSIFEIEHKFIRSSVLDLCGSDKFKVQVNPQQLLLALTLRGAKQTLMSLKDCTSVAKQCGIAEYDVIRSLSILEKKMLVVHVLETKWNTLVVVKPKVLSKKISMVIKHLMVMRANDPMCHPVIPYEKLREISKSSEKLEEHIETAILIKILIHLLIIVPVDHEKFSLHQTSYIVPSMLPHSLPTAITGIKFADNMIPSVADKKFIKAPKNELLFSVKRFKFRIPSTLHSLVLCTLMQNTNWTVEINECSKTCALFSRKMATFQLIFLREGILLSLKTNKSADIIEHCVDAKHAVSHALQSACKLVGYGAPIPTSYYLPCLKHNSTIQDGDSLIDHDCMKSHSKAGNVWFSEVRAFLYCCT